MTTLYPTALHFSFAGENRQSWSHLWFWGYGGSGWEGFWLPSDRTPPLSAAGQNSTPAQPCSCRGASVTLWFLLCGVLMQLPLRKPGVSACLDLPSFQLFIIQIFPSCFLSSLKGCSGPGFGQSTCDKMGMAGQRWLGPICLGGSPLAGRVCVCGGGPCVAQPLWPWATGPLSRSTKSAAHEGAVGILLALQAQAPHLVCLHTWACQCQLW